MTKVSTEDLMVAVDWLESYAAEPGKDNPCERVAAWLRAEAKKRIESGHEIRAMLRKKAGEAPKGRAPLVSPQDAQDIRDFYWRSEPNWTTSQLAHSFKVSQSVIRAVVDYKGAYGKGEYARKTKD